MSAPRSSRCVAKLCLQRVGRGAPVEPRGLQICFSSIRPTLRVVSRRPNLLTNTGASGPLFSRDETRRTAIHSLSARVANDPMGAIRSRRPLPRTRTVPPAKIEVRDVLSPANSLTRRPAEYSVSRMARSRKPQRARPCRAARPAGGSISSDERKCGSELATLARVAQRLGRIGRGPAFTLAKTKESCAARPVGGRSWSWRNRLRAGRQCSPATRPCRRRPACRQACPAGH